MPSLISRLTDDVGFRFRADSLGRIGAFFAVATAVLVLSGCDLPWSSTATAQEPAVRTSELADSGGRPCPQELPISDDPSGHGFGTEKVADELPALLEPQEAWVCTYNFFDVGTSHSGGITYGWRRAGGPETVAAADLPELQSALHDLEPADDSRGCPDDLGPKWMVVFSHDGDLTGVVVDGYGCRDVRLTENPHITPPGADNQDGTVGGVFDGGAEILDVLGLGRSN